MRDTLRYVSVYLSMRMKNVSFLQLIKENMPKLNHAVKCLKLVELRLDSAFLDFTTGFFLWRNLSASSAASVLAPFEMGDGAPALRSLRALAVTVFFVPLGIFYQRISDGYVLVS